MILPSNLVAAAAADLEIAHPVCHSVWCPKLSSPNSPSNLFFSQTPDPPLPTYPDPNNTQLFYQVRDASPSPPVSSPQNPKCRTWLMIMLAVRRDRRQRSRGDRKLCAGNKHSDHASWLCANRNGKPWPWWWRRQGGRSQWKRVVRRQMLKKLPHEQCWSVFEIGHVFPKHTDIFCAMAAVSPGVHSLCFNHFTI